MILDRRQLTIVVPVLVSLAVPSSGLGAAAMPSESHREVQELNREGVRLLSERKVDEAVGRLRAAVRALEALPQEEALDDASAARVSFNLAVALARAGRSEEAVLSYREALKLDPTYLPAKRGYERALLRLPQETRAHYGQVLVGTLIDQGNFEAASSYLDLAMTGATDRAGRPWVAMNEVPVELARLLVAQQMGPNEFGRVWLDRLPRPGTFDLDRGWRSLPEDPDRARLSLIAWAYVGEVPMVRSEREAEWMLGPWSGERDTFAALLRSVADAYQRSGDLEAAAPRYTLAWGAGADYGAAAYLAGLLVENSARLDPEGEILDRLVYGLFQAKGEAYASQDWEAIARYHTLLGRIFQAKREWGDEGSPASAVFQWEHAIEARDRLAGGSPSVVPTLHASLARALQESGRTAAAADSYLTAAEQYLATGRADEASAVLYRTDQLGAGALDERQRTRLLDAREQVERGLEGPSHVNLRDRVRSDALQRTLAADPALEGANLSVSEGADGTIRLEGKAVAPEQLREAEQLLRAKGVEGEVQVESVEIETVEPPGV